MRNNKLKETILFIGFDYKKELLKMILIPTFVGGLSVALYFLFKEFLFSIILLSFGILMDILLYSSYGKRKQKIINSRDDEFIVLINYFKSFISNKNNVYQSFNKILDYCSDWMKEKIERLLYDIDQDKSVKPYIDFADSFQMKIAKNIMLSIYQMVDEGEDELHLLQFETLLNELSKNSILTKKETIKKSLSYMSALPMVGTVYITLLLTFSIISIIGDFINVI